jgi:hypothetical protein
LSGNNGVGRDKFSRCDQQVPLARSVSGIDPLVTAAFGRCPEHYRLCSPTDTADTDAARRVVPSHVIELSLWRDVGMVGAEHLLGNGETSPIRSASA